MRERFKALKPAVAIIRSVKNTPVSNATTDPKNTLIHSADPRTRLVVIIIFAQSVRQSQLFKKIANKTNVT